MRFSIPWYFHDRAVRGILVLAAAAGLAAGLVIPFLTLSARDHGVSLTAIGIMASSYLLAQMFLQLPMGALSDRVGRIVPITLGLLIEASATAGFALADHTITFILLRVGQGVGVAILFPSYRALVADSTPLERRGQAYAVAGAAFTGGLLFGPPIGGALTNLMSVTNLYLAAGAIQVVVAIWVLFYFSRLGINRAPTQNQERVPFSELLSRPLAGAFILGFAAQFQFGLFSGIWSIFMKDLGASDLELGLSFSTFSVSFMLVAPLAGRLADRGDRWRRLLLANLIYAAVIMLYGLIPSVPSILILGLIEGAIVGTTQPAVDAYLSSVADPRIQGRVQGAFMTIGMAGAAISALLGSVLYGFSLMLPFLVGGIVLLGLALIAVYLIRETEHKLNLRRTTTGPEDALASLPGGALDAVSLSVSSLPAHEDRQPVGAVLGPETISDLERR